MKRILLIVAFISSCSVKGVVLKNLSPLIDEGIIEKIYAEENLIYLKDSLPANLKLLEIIYAKNEDILVAKNLAMGFCGYGYAFWEDEKELANSFYTKGIEYADGYIKKHNLKLKNSSDRKTQELFFASLFCRLAYIETNPDKPEAMDMVSEVEEIVDKLLNIERKYLNRSLLAIKALLLASKPPFAGGDIKKAKELFESSILDEGKDFLFNKYLYMRYAALILDEELFERLYNDIQHWSNERHPYAFFNRIAQIKAKKLKEKKYEYF